MTVRLWENPYYGDHKGDWILWRDLYNGDHFTLTSNPNYLWLHDFEMRTGDEDAKRLLAGRRMRTRYLNIQEINVSLWRSLFFRREGAADETLLKILGTDADNIDRENSSIHSFLAEQVFTNYINYGAVCVVADAPTKGAINRQEETTGGKRPYLKNLCPLDVKDWVFERDDDARWGKLNMLRYEYVKESPRKASDEPKEFWYCDVYERDARGAVSHTTYKGPARLGGKDRALVGTVHGGSWEPVGEPIELELKEIPAVLWLGTSWLKDSAQETLRHFNLRSARDNINHFQGYQKLYVKGGANMSDDQKKALAEYIMLLLGEGQEIGAIDAIDPIGLEKAEHEALQNAFKVGLNQFHALPSDSKETMSAEAANEMRRGTLDLVLSSIKEVEQLINQALGFYVQFKDKNLIGKPFEGRYNLSKEVTEEDIDALVQRYQALGDVMRDNPDWEIAHLKKIVKAEEYDDEDAEKISRALKPRASQQAPDRAAARTNLLRQRLNGEQEGSTETASA